MKKAGAWLAIGVLDVVALNLWVVPGLGGASAPAVAADALATTARSAPRPGHAAPLEVQPTPVEPERIAVAAAPTPVAVEPAPVPVEPAPVEPAPAPVEPAPVPVEPAPVAPAPAPARVPAPAPPVAPTPAPRLTAPTDAPGPVVIRFGFDRATILPVAARHLDELRQVLVEHPGWSLSVTGDASPDGDDDHNRQLSMRRARRIQEYLVDQGVDATRVELHGRGSAGDARRTATITVVERP